MATPCREHPKEEAEIITVRGDDRPEGGDSSSSGDEEKGSRKVVTGTQRRKKGGKQAIDKEKVHGDKERTSNRQEGPMDRKQGGAEGVVEKGEQDEGSRIHGVGGKNREKKWVRNRLWGESRKSVGHRE